MRTRILTILLLTGALAGGGNEGTTPSDPADAGSAPKAPASATPTALPTEIPAAPGLVTTGDPITVLSKGEAPAEACLGVVKTSLPPQCGGPVLDDFEWSDHTGDYEKIGDVRWGEFVVVGHFDGQRIRVTKVVPENVVTGSSHPSETDPFTTPCPVPAGGWPDADEPEQKAFRAAAKLPGYADGWVDYLGGVTVVNIRVTGDLAAAETELRKAYSGPLCVTRADRTAAEIRRISAAMRDLPGALSWGGDNEPIEASVLWDDGSLQAWADHEYGDGVVTIHSALQPAPADR